MFTVQNLTHGSIKVTRQKEWRPPRALPGHPQSRHASCLMTRASERFVTVSGLTTSAHTTITSLGASVDPALKAGCIPGGRPARLGVAAALGAVDVRGSRRPAGSRWEACVMEKYLVLTPRR